MAVSSDAAEALELGAGRKEHLAIFALRPREDLQRKQSASAESAAHQQLEQYVVAMDHSELLQLVAAAMRSMGYATTFVPGTDADARDMIRAIAAVGENSLPPIRVDVRTSDAEAARPDELAAFQSALSRRGEIGVLVSVPGFEGSPTAALTPGAAHVEAVDLNSLVHVWVANYELMTDADRDLLRLKPVYFLASN